MIRLAAESPKIPPEPISDVQHLKSKSGRHISRVSVPHLRFLLHFLTIRNQTIRDVLYLET
jgi:hypothetical protein